MKQLYESLTVRGWGEREGGCLCQSACSHLPSEDQTQQRADEDEHLVEHGRVGPLDGAVEVVLPTQGGDKYKTSSIYASLIVNHVSGSWTVHT